MYTKKNQGNVPKCKDERLRYVPTKCGKCIECRKEKARNWRIRLAEELKKSPNALFITLTFNEENYQKLAWELFKKDEVSINKATIELIIAKYTREAGVLVLLVRNKQSLSLLKLPRLKVLLS